MENQEIIFKVDSLLPPEIAHHTEEIGVKKANMPFERMFVLAFLAGAFIALGAIFATTIATGTGDMPFGVSKLLTGFVFCLGLILVVVAGAELFTGNNLIIIAWAARKIDTAHLLQNWFIVYVGNFVGSVATALIVVASKQYTFDGGAVGQTALNIANGKVQLEFVQAIALGMMCNALVCLAVWLTFSARTTVDKIAAIIFPITAFVAAGFEHSVANMYFIPVALFIKATDPTYVESLGVDYSALTWETFLVDNLLPVTIGNIIGGTLMVGAVYWFVYIRSEKA